MSMVIFLLLICICLGLIYIVHRYFDKHEFYILTIIYSVLSFIMSFKLLILVLYFLQDYLSYFITLLIDMVRAKIRS